MRTIVDLPNDQIEALKQMSECVHLSRAELMRRAVAEYLMRHQTHPDDHAFGLWKLHEKNSLDYQERMRREWEE